MDIKHFLVVISKCVPILMILAAHRCQRMHNKSIQD